MSVKFLLIPASIPRRIWREFIAVCGPKEIEDAYGWEPGVIPCPTNGEEVIACYQDGVLAGWWSRKPLPTRGQDYEVVLGVFPEYRGSGLGNELIHEAEMWGRRENVDSLTQVILGSNVRRLKSMLRHDLEGSAWRYAGCEWYPDSRYFFTWVREDADAPTPFNAYTAFELRKLEQMPEIVSVESSVQWELRP